MNKQEYDNQMIRYGTFLFGYHDSAKLKEIMPYHQLDCQSGTIDQPGTAGEVAQEGSELVNTLGEGMTNVIDANHRTYEYAHQVSYKDYILREVTDGVQMELKRYLSKPLRTHTGNFTAADAGVLEEIDCTTPLYNNLMYRRKLDGIFAMRFTTVVTLMVNATRFTAGRYILAWLPTAGGDTNLPTGSIANPWRQMKLYSLKTVTQLPHVEIDINRDTQVQLRIPYVSATQAWNIPNKLKIAGSESYGSPGTVVLYTYNGINAIADVTAGYDIYFHYEDIELYSYSLEAQSGKLDTAEMRRDGPVSSVLHNANRTVRGVSLFASKIFNSLEWVTDYASGAAAYLGFSAPMLKEPSIFVKNEMYPSFNNADAGQAVTSLSIMRNPNVQQDAAIFATEVDEMAIDFVKSIYCYDEKINWNTAQAVDTVLYDEYVSPGEYWQAITDSAGSNSNVVMAPITMLNNMFEKYRGGVTYKFKMVKTEFHTGRLLVRIYPYDQNTMTGVTYNTSSDTYLHRTVIDTRVSNEFEIEVPFISTSMWKTTGNAWKTQSVTNTAPYARIVVTVLNPLVAPSTVSGTCTIIVEVKGSKDLEFACPKNLNICPVIPTTLSTQSGLITIGNEKTGTIGSSSVENHTVFGSAFAIGEIVRSLRVLLRRPGYHSSTTDATFLTGQLYPFHTTAMVNNGTVNPTTSTFGTARDYYNFFSSCYALKRGGVRISILPRTAGDAYLVAGLENIVTSTATPTLYAATTGTFSFSNFVRYFSGNNIYFNQLSYGATLQVPQYSNNHAIQSSANLDPAGYTTAPSVGLINSVKLNFALSGNGIFSVTRAGADDCTFGVWTGCPPVVRENYD